jgi:3-oxoacyl-[acyl-carrier protein] reductase
MVRQRRGGRIIAVTSVPAAPALAGTSAPAAADAAVRAAAACWALELAPFGITVNSVGPAPVPGTSALSPDAPSTLAHLVCWLASAESGNLTGAHLVAADLTPPAPTMSVAPALRIAEASGLDGEAILAALDAHAGAMSPTAAPASR